VLNEDSWWYLQVWDETYMYARRVDGVSVTKLVLLAISPAHLLKADQAFLSEGVCFYVCILNKQQKKTSH